MLTPDNYDELTADKTVLLKFFAPWCGHCKKLKPTWDVLMAEFADSKDKLVADVDCTAEGKPLCDANGVKGFPTLKYGDPSDLQAYEGGRSEADLRKHIEEKLGPQCSVKHIDLCDKDKKALIGKFQAMKSDALAMFISDQEAAIKKLEEDFKASVEELQKLYEGLTKDREAKEAALKDGGLGLAKAVKKSLAVKTDEL